ncbi:MAG TPA: phospholipase D-like domain-containing protein [Casimicrobiaceae bacterium]|nr:phospholipase D-like domain-containing protein [Casimicrobiaceae bacterium]
MSAASSQGRDAATPSQLAERAFARATGAVAVGGNDVRLLLDAKDNYPAWLAAIESAHDAVRFETYIIADDATGRTFTDALCDRSRAGVQVFALFDWLGSHGASPLFERLRAAGVHVRVFNPPRLADPLGWITRNHRKTVTVDGRIAFVSGLCVSDKWEGDAERQMQPWRDTGIEIRGPAVADVARAFDDVWRTCAGADAVTPPLTPEPRQGDVSIRVVEGIPNHTGTYRLDLVIASLARRYLWLTDAYFVGTSAYVQALAAAANDGVDVRLLVPGASDIPALRPLSRASYRALIEAGVRVYEWNGTMLHAKSAVADDRWSRIGSTNLNLASWMGNYELDVAVEDAPFATAMAAQYERDLEHATEVVLTRRLRVRNVDHLHSGVRRARSGSAGRAAAGAVSVGSVLGAALTNRRHLAPAESSVLFYMAIFSIAISALVIWKPHIVAWPLAAIGIWLGGAWLYKAIGLRRGTRPSAPSLSSQERAIDPPPEGSAASGSGSDLRL